MPKIWTCPNCQMPNFEGRGDCFQCAERSPVFRRRKMMPIPIAAAKKIADAYGYDQVIIVARRVGTNPLPNGEHLTTYGVDKDHCDVAARAGAYLAEEILKWVDSMP